MALIDVNWRPSRNELRVFGLLLLGFAAAVSWLLSVRWQLPTAAIWTGSIFAAAGALGLVWPPLLRPVYVTWMAAALPIGWVVSHVLMGVVFYLVVTPIGLIMRLAGHDPMSRTFDRKAESYWIERDPPAPPDRYFRQF